MPAVRPGGPVADDDRREEVGLVRELLEQGRPQYVRGIGDPGERGLVVPVLREQLRRCGEDGGSLLISDTLVVVEGISDTVRVYPR